MRFKPGLATGYAEELPAVDANGNPTREINWILTKDELEQVSKRYRCRNCMEPFSSQTDLCTLCGYDMSRQAEDLQRTHQGEKWYGPSPDSVLDEEREREAWIKKTGIWIP